MVDQTLDKFTAYVFKFDETKNNALIQRCVAFIHNHYKENLNLDMVANMVHLNASYFSSLFKREVGVSFSNYLNKVRIEKSMQLLKNTALSILEVALEVGYEDQSYFGKVFKSVINMTPKEYKQKLL